MLFNLGGSHLKFGGPAAGTDNGIEIRRGSIYQIEEDMNENNRTQDKILQLGERKGKERRKKTKLTDRWLVKRDPDDPSDIDNVVI